jgi:hypothetical protein
MGGVTCHAVLLARQPGVNADHRDQRSFGRGLLRERLANVARADPVGERAHRGLGSASSRTAQPSVPGRAAG